MATLDRSPMTMTGTIRPAFAVRMVRATVDFMRGWKNRREIYRLGNLTDSELSDIGLRRADLHVAWRMPLGTDPTSCLGALAEARAANELRSSVERVSLERAAREVS